MPGGPYSMPEEYAPQSSCLEMVINFTVNSSVTHCLWLDVHCGFLPVIWKNINWRPALGSFFPGFLNETTCFKLNKYIPHLHIQHQDLNLESTKIQLASIFIFFLFISSLFSCAPESYKALIICLPLIFFFYLIASFTTFYKSAVELLQPQTLVWKLLLLGYCGFSFQGFQRNNLEECWY